MLGTYPLIKTGERNTQEPVPASSPAPTSAFLRGLTRALRAHDVATWEHGNRTCALAARAATELGWKNASLISHVALLHDVGKLGVPRSILRKPGGLNEAEWRVMRRHPEMGAGLLRGIAGFEPVREAILAHHERFDGRGYPSGLAGAEIPIEARLICVADAYDAMTSERPYGTALGHAEAIERLNSGAGTQFDSAMVEAVEDALSLPSPEPSFSVYLSGSGHDARYWSSRIRSATSG